MKQNHHIIPLSLGGIHFIVKNEVNLANIVAMEEAEHKLVHKFLDIQYHHIRNFRMKYSICDFKDVDYYTDLHKLQKMYFANLMHLPEHLVQAHVESIKGQNKVLSEHFKCSINLFDNAEFYNNVYAFNFYLDIYHKIFISRTTKYLN